MRRLVIILASVLIFVAPAAIMQATWGDESPVADSPASAALRLGLLGDSSTTDLLRAFAAEYQAEVEVAKGRLTATIEHNETSIIICAPVPAQDLAAATAVAAESDVALLTVDATQGPTPISREHTLVIRHMNVPVVGVIFTKTAELFRMPDGQELLELEELEVRELLNAYGLPGDAALCILDSPEAPAQEAGAPARGLRNGATALSRIDGRRSSEGSSREQRSTVTASIYVLARKESQHAVPIETGQSLDIYLNGRLVRGKSKTVIPIGLGGNGEIEIALDQPTPVRPGDRFVIGRQDHVVAVGVVE